jgi:hypothetical protein
MDLVPSESGTDPVHTALDPSLVTCTERSWVKRVGRACNADSRITVKRVVGTAELNKGQLFYGPTESKNLEPCVILPW